MNHSFSHHKNTALLVSVRNVGEATTVIESDCVSVVDLKEPQNGSLGCVSIESAVAVLDVMPADTLCSIALGEVLQWPFWPQTSRKATQTVLSRFDFAKVGLAGLASMPDWRSIWKSAFSLVPESVARVAVAYADSLAADSPPILEVVEASIEVGCSVLLIDTFDKSSGGLFQCASAQLLQSAVLRARELGMKTVLAGSLRQSDLTAVAKFAPDLIGVRGAVCRGDRQSAVDCDKIKALHRELQLSANSQSIERSQSPRKAAADSNR